MKSQAQSSTHASGKHFHVVPLRVLAAVWVLLVVLTWITVGATTVDLGNLNIAIALFIAAVKSIYVALYFMHLRYDNPFHALIFLTGLGFVALFIGLALMDTKQYAADEIPGYAPEIEAVPSTP
jgi:cytochrome c oxidase subunit 4